MPSLMISFLSIYSTHFLITIRYFLPDFGSPHGMFITWIAKLLDLTKTELWWIMDGTYNNGDGSRPGFIWHACCKRKTFASSGAKLRIIRIAIIAAENLPARSNFRQRNWSNVHTTTPPTLSRSQVTNLMKLGMSKGILETSHNKSIYENVKSGVELVRRQVRISLPKIKPPTTGHSTHNSKSNKGAICLAREAAFVMAEVAEKQLYDDLKQHQQQQQQQSESNDVVVVPNPKPSKGLASKVVDLVEKLIVKLMYDTSQPHHYLAGNFAPVVDETPPTKDLNVIGHLPVSLLPSSILQLYGVVFWVWQWHIDLYA